MYMLQILMSIVQFATSHINLIPVGLVQNEYLELKGVKLIKNQ